MTDSITVVCAEVQPGFFIPLVVITVTTFPATAIGIASQPEVGESQFFIVIATFVLVPRPFAEALDTRLCNV